MTAAVNVASLGTAMSADSSGNVGIGASPSYRLDVNATSFIAASVSTSYSGAGNIRIADASTTSASAPYIGSVGNNLTFGRIGTAEYARIDSSGRVTTPFQPSFLAVSTSGDTTVTAGSPIPLNVAATNVGSCYNTSNYRFTAPVAGKYLFNAVVYYTSSGGNNQSMQAAVFVNGSQYVPSGGGDAVLFSSATPSVTSVISIGGSVILNLAANDYVTVSARGTNGRFYLGHTNFSGQLIS